MIFTHIEFFSIEKFKKFVFYGCKQKVSNNIVLHLDLSNKVKNY